MRRITEPMARTNQGPGAMNLNITKVRIKSDMTTMISNLVGNRNCK
jgi:hypothetical protein